MRRRLLNLAAAVSLVLCLAMGALWVRALFVIDHLTWNRWTQHPLTAHDRDYARRYRNTADVTLRNNRFQMVSWRGTLVFEHLHHSGGYDRDNAERMVGSRFEWAHQPIDYRSTVWGDAWTNFGFRADKPSLDPLVHYVSVPLWVLMLACTVPPVVLLRRRMRARALAKSGRCPCCGYDLRATPDRCPECGEPPPNPPMQRTGRDGIFGFKGRHWAGR